MGADAGGGPALAAAHPAAGRRALLAFRNRDRLPQAGFVVLEENQPREAISLEKSVPADPVAVSCADGGLFRLASDDEGRLFSRRWRPAPGWEEWSPGPAEIDGPSQAVCGTDQRVYVALRSRAVQLLLVRLNGNRWKGAAPIKQEPSDAPLLASAVSGRLYVACVAGDGIIRLAEFLEQRQEVSARWNTEGGAGHRAHRRGRRPVASGLGHG